MAKRYYYTTLDYLSNIIQADGLHFSYQSDLTSKDKNSVIFHWTKDNKEFIKQSGTEIIIEIDDNIIPDNYRQTGRNYQTETNRNRSLSNDNGSKVSKFIPQVLTGIIITIPDENKTIKLQVVKLLTQNNYVASNIDISHSSVL